MKRKNPDICRSCERGEHGWCTGLRCRCTENARCRANARLTEDRLPDDAA